MRSKFGLILQDEGDNALINNFLELLYTQKKDYHRSLRMLLNQNENLLGEKFESWLKDYKKRINKEENLTQSLNLMKQFNPKYILRNYLAEVAIREAEDLKKYEEIDVLFRLLKKPFDSHNGYDSYDSEPPDWAKNLELSCSS
jgi:uncharacterized protein YdiU (UPF0061 family)